MENPMDAVWIALSVVIVMPLLTLLSVVCLFIVVPELMNWLVRIGLIK